MDGKNLHQGYMMAQGSAPYPHDNYSPQPAPRHNYVTPPAYSVTPLSQQQPQPMMMHQQQHPHAIQQHPQMMQQHPHAMQQHPQMMQQHPQMMHQQQPMLVEQQPQLLVQQAQPQNHPTTVVVSQAPGACTHTVIDSRYTTCGVLWLIFFFPIGLICCLTMKDRRCRNCGVRF